jgi:hypothetical protein
MLEEWRSGDGIEVLDGWTFQVSLIFTDQITGPHLFAYSVLIRVSTRIPRNDRMSIIDLFFSIRSHVYFKNDKMHGKFFFLPPDQVHWILRLTPLQDLDKHLGDLYPSIIGMFSSL